MSDAIAPQNRAILNVAYLLIFVNEFIYTLMKVKLVIHGEKKCPSYFLNGKLCGPEDVNRKRLSVAFPLINTN